MDIKLTDTQRKQCTLFQDLLLEWNKKINLTAIKKPEDVYIKHFVDSMMCLKAWNETSELQKLIDVGTGAGFPGLVIKIVKPQVHLTLVESIGKKVEFCKLIVEKLELSDVEVLQERAETLAHKAAYREKFDVAVARAVAPLSILSEYLLPFVKKGGIMIAMKGNRAQEEIDKANHVFTMLGGNFLKSIPYTLSGESDPRNIVVIQKNKSTSKEYPRSAGIPTRKPL